MILHPVYCEPSIKQISDLHNYMINSKVESLAAELMSSIRVLEERIIEINRW